MIIVMFLVGMQPTVTCATWTWGGATSWVRNFTRDHWKPILGIAALATLYLSRHKIIAPFYRLKGKLSQEDGSTPGFLIHQGNYDPAFLKELVKWTEADYLRDALCLAVEKGDTIAAECILDVVPSIINDNGNPNAAKKPYDNRFIYAKEVERRTPPPILRNKK